MMISYMRYIQLPLKSDTSLLLFFSGLFSASLQALLLRELLSVSSGNELIIGLVFSIWLSATAVGSEVGRRFPFRRRNAVIVLLIALVPVVLIIVRLTHLLLLPGEMLPPALLFGLLVVSECSLATLGGYIFGSCSICTAENKVLYRFEQAGSLIGLLLFSVSVACAVPHGITAAIVSLLLLWCITSIKIRLIAVCFPLILLFSDRATTAMKYPVAVHTVMQTSAGEVAIAGRAEEKQLFVNGQLYSTGFSTSVIEQAVHSACSMHPHPRKVLVVNNSGHVNEVMKYPDVTVDCIRTERIMDDTSCRYGVLARMRRNAPYDVIVVKEVMPETIASGRLYSVNVLQTLYSLIDDSGLVSLSIPFTSEFPDYYDKMVRDIVYTSIKSVFPSLLVIPGYGMTFIASVIPYSLPDTCPVPNDYFIPIIISGLSSDRFTAANTSPEKLLVHSAVHPTLLFAALNRYVEHFGGGWWLITLVPLMTTILLIILLQPDIETVSIGTSGLCVGIFSVAVMLLFQGLNGTIYAYSTLLLLALATGFWVGCYIKKFPFSDVIIGSVLGLMLCVLGILKQPPLVLFCIANGTAGMLSAGQFVTRSVSLQSKRYTADCIGGVLGMAFASTVLIPCFGLFAVAAGIFILKLIVESGVMLWRKKA